MREQVALAQLASVIEAAELPAELEELVTRQAAELAGAAGSGGLLAVRSSISLEDRAAGAAAGVFSSKVAVTPSEVWPAIRAVWASVCTPLAAAYAQQRARSVSQGQAGAAAAPLQVAVIVQRYAPGQRITVYTRQPGQPSSPLAAARNAAWVTTKPGGTGRPRWRRAFGPAPAAS